jgi:cytochrome b561
VSSIVHGLLYVLLLAMPVVGYVANSAYGEPTPFFALFKVPPVIAKDEALATTLFTVHRWAGWVLIVLVLMHIGAALYHHLAGDNVLRRMLPQALGGAEVAARASATRSR